MSTRSRWLLLVAGAAAMGTAFGETPDLGEPLEPDAAAAVDFTVLPDGDGLPPGSGTAAEGEPVYRTHCLACHGEGGEGGVNDALAGGHGSLTGPAPTKTVGSFWPYATTVFDYVRRAMPHQSPGTLTNDEIYAVTAYVLHLNGIVGEDEEMNAETLPAVAMPNRDNFVWGYPPAQ